MAFKAFPKWDYKVLKVDADKLQSELTKLGNVGWEAVGVSCESGGLFGSDDFVVVLKRPEQRSE